MPKRTDISSILIIGAGPIVIGQAAEFDYSGTQATKALKDSLGRLEMDQIDLYLIHWPVPSQDLYVETWQAFIDAIETAGGPTYDYRQIDPQNNQDGGQPGGNIRVVFLYRTDRGLSFVDRPGGTSTSATTVVRDAAGHFRSLLTIAICSSASSPAE